MNIYFSQKFTNFQKKDIKLEFSKKITKKLKSDLKKFFPYLNFLLLIILIHFLKLYQKSIYLFLFFLRTLIFPVFLEFFHLLFCTLIIVRYFLQKNSRTVFLSKKVSFLFLKLKNLFLWRIPFHSVFITILSRMPKIKMKSVFLFHL